MSNVSENSKCQFYVYCACISAVLAAISIMPQRDEADKYQAICIAHKGETATNIDGQCVIHAKLSYAEAQVPTLICPVAGQCTDDTMTSVNKP